MQGELPQGVIGPIINDEYGDVDSILYMLTGDGADYAQLKKVADALRQQTLKVPNVVKVNIYGIQDQKIYVEFSHAKLATLGVTPQALFESLARQNAVAPAGVVETSSQRVCVRVTGSARRRQSGGGNAGGSERPRIPPRRHRHHHPRLRGSRPTTRFASAASRRSASAWSWPRAATCCSSARI